MTNPQKRDAPSPKQGRKTPISTSVQSPKLGQPYLPYPSAAQHAGGEPVLEGVGVEDPAAGLSSQLRWDRDNPKAKWAHQALRSAINKGLIERGPCKVCGARHGEAGAVIHGHHDDYDRPTHVRWLCQTHHRQHHAAERRAQQETDQ